MGPSTPSTPARRKIRILIVDDNPMVRQDLHQLLTLSGELEVVGEAACGAEAIVQADAIRPQVILMDLFMPGMDGFEAAKQIKILHPDCRVIAHSLYSYPQAQQKASQAGMDGFIEKGNPLQKLIETIKQIWYGDQNEEEIMP